MSFVGVGLLISLGLFAGMMLLMVVGRRVGARLSAREPSEAQTGTGAIEAALFGLMGLLVAFTFSGATTRFDTRRELIVAETNAIGTAYLRLDLLPERAQPSLRDLFRRYVDSRLATYRMAADRDAAAAELAHSIDLQRQIWREAVAAGRVEAGAQPSALILLVPALNQMIDITTTRLMSTRMHPPVVVFVMLIGLELACAFLAGFSLARSRAHRWQHMFGFAAAMSIAVYVILDIEYPRRGLITVEAFDQALVQLRASMQ